MSRIEGSLHVTDHLSAASMTIPDSTIKDAAVASDAGVKATKLEHQHHIAYSQDGTVATASVPVNIVRAQYGAQVVDVRAVLMTANVGDATVDVDVKVGGVSILTSAIQFTSSDAGGTVKVGSLDASKTARAKDDVLVVEVTANAGTGTLGQDLLVQIVTREGAD